MDNNKEYILCAAVKRKRPRKTNSKYPPYDPGENDILNIEIGYRHHDIYQRFSYPLILNDLIKLLRKFHLNDICSFIILKTSPLAMEQENQGFYTSKGRFVDRHEGMKIAIEAGQVDLKKGEVGDLTENDKKIFGIESNDKDYWRKICKGYAPLFSEDLY